MIYTYSGCVNKYVTSGVPEYVVSTRAKDGALMKKPESIPIEQSEHREVPDQDRIQILRSIKLSN